MADDGLVEIRPVEPGERVGGLWVIDKGLKPGDKVIVAGLQYVRPGMSVKAKLAPAEEGTPAEGPGKAGDSAGTGGEKRGGTPGGTAGR